MLCRNSMILTTLEPLYHMAQHIWVQDIPLHSSASSGRHDQAARAGVVPGVAAIAETFFDVKSLGAPPCIIGDPIVAHRICVRVEEGSKGNDGLLGEFIPSWRPFVRHTHGYRRFRAAWAVVPSANLQFTIHSMFHRSFRIDCLIKNAGSFYVMWLVE